MNQRAAQPISEMLTPQYDLTFQVIDSEDSIQQALRAIAEGTATATGTEFFYALVRELA